MHIWTIEYNVIMNNANISHLVVNVVIQYEILILTSYIIDILLFTLVVLSNQIITLISLLTKIKKHYNHSRIILYQVFN